MDDLDYADDLALFFVNSTSDAGKGQHCCRRLKALEIIRILTKRRRNYYSSDQGRLFRAIRTLLGKNDKTLLFPDYDDNKLLLVNDKAWFFAWKILWICDQIDSTVIADMNNVPDDAIVSDAKILSEFKPLSEADILALIQKSSKKTCNLDPMPTKLVVESLDHLLSQK